MPQLGIGTGIFAIQVGVAVDAAAIFEVLTESQHYRRFGTKHIENISKVLETVKAHNENMPFLKERTMGHFLFRDVVELVLRETIEIVFVEDEDPRNGTRLMARHQVRPAD